MTHRIETKSRKRKNNTKDGKGSDTFRRSFYSPVFKIVFDAFGEDRIVYGSNWPVTDWGGSYSEQLGIIRGYFNPPVMRLDDSERGERIAKKLFRENALRFYGLE